ncbi:mechanosensitive ion channel domain-containing protein [Dyadobacter sp. LHD-138]|uniref:mechanosensitive ion channel domain-containing protein n=1 Tax=Dyadobacter sp. LHD-138 TaxID=3071413 RepID=UPI0027E18C97|nr:mechanosensitive ion channel domain-containing protein [Dyadobacter sp. LHD-138]MDQ6482042.1 mechanosensitive ion channel [Dyadobacter sp. LHD-138]
MRNRPIHVHTGNYLTFSSSIFTNFVCSGLFVCILSLGSTFGQSVPDSTTKKQSTFSSRAQQAIRSVAENSRRKYEDETVAFGQQRTLDRIEKEIQAAKLFIKSELDTNSVSAEIEKARLCFNVVRGGTSIEKGEISTHRNLTVSSAILTQLLRDMRARKSHIDKMTERMVGHRYQLDSLSTDSLLYTLSADSATVMAYMNKLMISNLSIKPIDSLIDKTISNLQTIQSGLDPLVFELDLALEGLESEKEQLSKRLLARELPNLWESAGLNTVSQVIRFSYAKEAMVLQFYLANYSGRFLILLVALLISTVFLYSLRSRYREGRPVEGPPESTRVLSVPLPASVLIVISFLQFIFIDPPFIISILFWSFSILSLAVIFRGYISRYWMRFWLTMAVLFLIVCLDNMLLQASIAERWLMLALSGAGMLYTGQILRGNQLETLKEKYIVYAIRFFVLSEFFALIFNILGRYNLAKTLMVSGYVGLIIAILFLWAVRMIDEALRLANSVYKSPDRKLFYVNFDRLGNRAPALLYVLLCLGWLILVGRNYFEFKQIISPFNLYITESRSIGDYEFTIRDLLLFIGIGGSAVLLSRLVSFFATDPGIQTSDHPGGAASIAANWLLLIRILIITAGILLAFAASGIALDRLTIIIGALGVGIGLGLQNLVTNLVSGLIIAFERPVSVGDQVEVNGKFGTMKSIGFRSSVISLADGASMIVPNGDLLSQHLINWTMGKNKRRQVIKVGVAYGSDLATVKNVLLASIAGNENIMSRPQPTVLTKEFATNAIDFEVVFWVRNMDQSGVVQDQVINRIDLLFRQNGIVIPFTHQDINVTMQQPNEKK